MYKNGELDRVMSEFEKTLGGLPVYVGGTAERAEKQEVELESGMTSNRYVNNNYYNNGHVNQLFLLYLNGYSSGKLEGRMEDK